MILRTIGTTAMAAAALLATGCVDDEIERGNPLGAFMKFLAQSSKAPSRVVSLSRTTNVQVNASIGGLSGTFDVALSGLGGLAGTAKIGADRKSATFVAEDTEELKALCEEILELNLVQTVEVSSARVKVKGRQTTGGVKKFWNGKLTYRGVVVGGKYDGRPVKGKITSKGKV